MSLSYREVKLDLPPEIEVFHMLFERCHTKNRIKYIKQLIKYFNFRCNVQLDHPVRGQVYRGWSISDQSGEMAYCPVMAIASSSDRCLLIPCSIGLIDSSILSRRREESYRVRWLLSFSGFSHLNLPPPSLEVAVLMVFWDRI